MERARPQVFAHRGLSSERTENTHASFSAAAAAGFAGIEMDLQLSRDGEVVVLHDEELERTTGFAGRVGDLDYREINAHPTKDGPVPRLRDLFGALAHWQGTWNLEIKAEAALEPTLALLATGPRHVILSCMDPEPLERAAVRAPERERALITLGPVDEADIELAQGAQATWLNADEQFLEVEAVARVRAAHLRLGAWTVNDTRRAQELAGWGVEAVITDRRDVLKALAP
ncbi:MAG: glycerophosphodiester phosphodiesterase [Thermoplasmatota archaeon]